MGQGRMGEERRGVAEGWEGGRGMRREGRGCPMIIKQRVIICNMAQEQGEKGLRRLPKRNCSPSHTFILQATLVEDENDQKHCYLTLIEYL